jgi:PadR family transcriptional regulator PadR
MPRRQTERAVADAAPLETARRAAGARGAGSQDPLVAELRRAGLLPLLVLHFLAREPSYGNLLMEHVTELTGGLIAVNPNTMYPLLRSLEQQGLVRGEWEHPERRSRRFYRLTPAGDAERRRLGVELGPRLDAVAAGIDLIRRELEV